MSKPTAGPTAVKSGQRSTGKSAGSGKQDGSAVAKGAGSGSGAGSRVRSARRPTGWFTGVRIIAGRELGAYFASSIAYVFAIAFVVLANTVFMNEFFIAGRADMTGYFELMPLLLPVFLPALTMRLWAEERRLRTIELLLTLPITPMQAVLGKYIAALCLYLLLLLGSLPIVVMLYTLGPPDGGLIVGGYIGLILLGAMLLALGTFLSALSRDQIVAFVLTALFGLFIVLTGDDRVAAVLDGLAPEAAFGSLLRDTISATPRYASFVRGLIEPAAVVYFAGLSAALLWLNGLLLGQVRT